MWMEGMGIGCSGESLSPAGLRGMKWNGKEDAINGWPPVGPIILGLRRDFSDN
jgi:hypothetical protein